MNITTIRPSAFETNSSSSHSIILGKNDFIPASLHVYGGVLEIHAGRFGWGVEYIRSPIGKASYCLTWLKSSEQDYKRDVTKQTTMFINVLRETTGAKVVQFLPISVTYNGQEPEIDWGYIDHQSIEDEDGGALAPVWDSPEKLRNFLFNQESILIIDNDNR